ncbi:MAG: sigma-70 family RNA polymerase sigma factor [Deferribacteraceae bacterium]|jgi:RNA polymerase sigma factor (sigma-70 family)|nr:sigma-70 family RNA polymerase sigma factor [Deferribacteraceae bacterium]
MSAGDVFIEKGAELFRFIRRRVRSDEDAEDILQDVFCQFHRAEILLSPIENIYAWLYRTARNKIIDLWRKKKELPVSDFLEDDDTEDNLNEIVSNPIREFFRAFYPQEDDYIKNIFWERFEAALDKLPPNQREVFELTEFEGATFKELSEEKGIPINTLISRKHYAVLSLRKNLADIHSDMLGAAPKKE